MARASYIWIVLNSLGRPMAAFTVKHELQTWLEQRTSGTAWRVMRIRHWDQFPTLLTIEEALA